MDENKRDDNYQQGNENSEQQQQNSGKKVVDIYNLSPEYKHIQVPVEEDPIQVKQSKKPQRKLSLERKIDAQEHQHLFNEQQPRHLSGRKTDEKAGIQALLHQDSTDAKRRTLAQKERDERELNKKKNQAPTS
jgi:hypothetical protein